MFNALVRRVIPARGVARGVALWVALWAMLALGCGGGRARSHPDTPAVPAAYPATRWVPAAPTYVLAAPSLRGSQRSVLAVLDVVGIVAGLDGAAVGTALARLLAVDPLRPDALAAIGIDVEAGFAVFSDDLAPTAVVRIDAPDLLQAFVDGARARGLVTHAVVREGVEVVSATLADDLTISWAVDDGWLWVHVAPAPLADDAGAWFTASHRPRGARWLDAWAWGTQALGTASAPPGLRGFISVGGPGGLVARALGRAPAARDLRACTQLLAPVGRVAVALTSDEATVGAQVAIEIGPAAAAVDAAALAVPEGFATAAAGAPLVAQWNLDAFAIRAWLAPCLRVLGEDGGELDRRGIRGGRAALQALDPDDRSGRGVVALDLVHGRYLRGLLDDIPMRSLLERKRAFGPHRGAALAVPMVATVEYVLTEGIALAGVGEGLLGAVVGDGALVRGPLLALDVAPPALSASTWRFLLDAAGLPADDRMTARLLRWREGHVAVTVEGSALVLRASGIRR